MDSKIKKKNTPKSINEMSQEMLQETLKKKRECNAKALQVVEKLCEIHVDKEWFLTNLQYINQTHFDDAIIERAITKVCGYPLCTRQLEKVPAQQYHISTRYNKVFDITERKNFCSACCYKSAMYVKKQLFTSPLWFRDQETIPEYRLLKTSKSSMAGEVVFLLSKNIKPSEMEDLRRRNTQKTKLDEGITELEEKCSKLKIQGVYKEKDNVNESGIENIKKKSNCQREMQKNEILEKLQESKSESNKTVILENGNNSDIKRSNGKVMDKEPTDAIARFEESVTEWFSLDTFFYLNNEERLKELLSDKASKIKEILNSNLSIAGCSGKIERMIKLYGLLDSNCFGHNYSKMNLKPLPNYSALKEEGKNLEVKVRAFYQGQLEMEPSDKKDEKKEENDDQNPIYMPLVDAYAQTALRRKIILDKLNKLLPDIIRDFSSDYVVEMNEVRSLVATFSLSATNITFRPTEWYLVGIFIIKLLSLKNKHLECIMNLESSHNKILLILMSYGLEKNYLDDLICRINDSSILMKLVDK